MKENRAYLGKYKPGAPIHIIGGGFSGLTIAYYLTKENIPFKLFEKEKSLGGKIQSSVDEHGVFEQAANAIYSNDQVMHMLSDLNLEYERAKPNLKKYLLRNNRLTNKLIKKKEILKIILRLFKKTPNQDKEDLSVSDFFTPLLGKEFCAEVLASAFTGVYAEHISQLHHRSIFRLPVKKSESYLAYLLRLKRSKVKSKEKGASLNFKNGLSDLIQALRSFIGDNIITESLKTDISLEFNTIIATDAHDAANLVEKKLPMIASELKKITYKTLNLTHLFTTHEISRLRDAFGMVFHPKSKNKVILGVLANSSIFSRRTNSETVFSYSFITKTSHHFEQDFKQDLDSLELQEITDKKLTLNTTAWKRAIPLYDYERFQAIQKSHKLIAQAPSGVIIAGNYIEGISLREILKNSKSLVDDIKKEIRND